LLQQLFIRRQICDSGVRWFLSTFIFENKKMGIGVDGLQIVHQRGEILLPNYHMIRVVIGELIDKTFDRHVCVGLNVMLF
jgi:hypothetical protein